MGISLGILQFQDFDTLMRNISTWKIEMLLANWNLRAVSQRMKNANDFVYSAMYLF